MKDRSKILSLLFAIGRRMRDEGRVPKKEEKYSMLHFHTLRFIEGQGKPTMHDVARFLCVTRPAATLLIDGLVQDRLLSRSLDKKDRRAVRLSITLRGKSFLARAIRKRVGKLDAMFSSLTAEERAHLIAILEKIAKRSA